MAEPAQGPSGITYERAAIMEWLASKRCCPITQAPLRRRHISPNLSLRQVIEAWLEQQGVPQLLRQEQQEQAGDGKKDQ
jgi:hypothetical protein